MHGQSPSQKSIEQPQAGGATDNTDTTAGAAYTASAVVSSSTLQHTPGDQDQDPSLPDTIQHPTLDPVPDPLTTTSEQPQASRTSDASARHSTSPVKMSSPLSIPSQLSSIRTPTPPASSFPEGATAAGSIHSNSTDRLLNAPQASVDPSSIPQLESLHPASYTPNVAASDSASSNGCALPAAPTSAQLDVGTSSDADMTDPSNLQNSHHLMSDLVPGPVSNSADATLGSELASSSGDNGILPEPASRSVDVDLASELASSPTGSKGSEAGTQQSSHEPHATSGAAAPTVTDSASTEVASTTLPQPTLSNEAGSPDTAEAGSSSHAYTEAGMAGSDSPHVEHPQAGTGTDAVPWPSTASSDIPHAEQTQADTGTDAVPGPSTGNSDSPHTQRQNSSAAASTSGAEEAAPRTHGHAHRLDAHKGTPVGCLTKGISLKFHCRFCQWLL